MASLVFTTVQHPASLKRSPWRGIGHARSSSNWAIPELSCKISVPSVSLDHKTVPSRFIKLANVGSETGNWHNCTRLVNADAGSAAAPPISFMMPKIISAIIMNVRLKPGQQILRKRSMRSYVPIMRRNSPFVHDSHGFLSTSHRSASFQVLMAVALPRRWPSHFWISTALTNVFGGTQRLCRKRRTRGGLFETTGLKLKLLIEVEERLRHRIGAIDQCGLQAILGKGLHAAVGQLNVAGTLMQVGRGPIPRPA